MFEGLKQLAERSKKLPKLRKPTKKELAERKKRAEQASKDLREWFRSK
jgi:hypothetical protein